MMSFLNFFFFFFAKIKAKVRFYSQNNLVLREKCGLYLESVLDFIVHAEILNVNFSNRAEQ